MGANIAPLAIQVLNAEVAPSLRAGRLTQAFYALKPGGHAQGPEPMLHYTKNNRVPWQRASGSWPLWNST